VVSVLVVPTVNLGVARVDLEELTRTRPKTLMMSTRLMLISMIGENVAASRYHKPHQSLRKAWVSRLEKQIRQYVVVAFDIELD